MKTNRKEYLSAFLDDEAGEFERRLLYRELREDESLRDDLSRYALIRESLKSQERLQIAKPDFLQGIQEQIEADEIVEQESSVSASQAGGNNVVDIAKQRSYKMPWLGYGVAAGVAAMATAVGMMLLQPNTTTNTLDVVTATEQAVPASANVVQTAGAEQPVGPVVRSLYSASLDPETRKMLKRYVAQHSRYAATNAIIPSVRAVSYVRDY